MRATFKLLNSYFWKTYYGPILVFIFPTLLLTILGNIMRIEYVLPGIIAMVTLFIGIQVMPLGIMELKGSTLFKYIGSTPVNPKRFALAVVLYYVLLNLLAIVLVLVLGSAIFYKDIYYHSWMDAAGKMQTGMTGITHGLYSGIVSWKGCLSFIVANIFHIIMTLAIGLAIATFAKTPQQALTLGLIVVIPSMFLSGMVITVDVIARSSVMQWLSRLVVFRYTTGNIVISSTPTYQLGNILNQINTSSQLNLIFAKGATIVHNGTPYIKASMANGATITHFNDLPGDYVSMTDFKAWLKHITETIENDPSKTAAEKATAIHNIFSPLFSGGDATLFKQIFNENAMKAFSDNNLFRWDHNWGVRRIPDVESIQRFITVYFKGNNNHGGGTTRFTNIYTNYIQKGNFAWLNMFMNQNIVLYTQAERILNMVVPILVTAGAATFTIKKFSWSAR